MVFYGSSTIRLWNSLQDDFPHTNTLNLGFGGAFISSLSQNFDRLFTFEAPKAIVLYLGGNDLSLGWTAEKIIEKIAEETDELIAEITEDPEKNKVIHEAADLWFHVMVLLTNNGIDPTEVLKELESREGLSGIEEKKGRKE